MPPEDSPKTSVDALIEKTQKFIAEVLADFLKRPLGEVWAWAKRKIIAVAIGVVLVAAAIVLLTLGAVEGIKQTPVPPYAVYLAIGAISLAGGVFALRR